MEVHNMLESAALSVPQRLEERRSEDSGGVCQGGDPGINQILLEYKVDYRVECWNSLWHFSGGSESLQIFSVTRSAAVEYIRIRRTGSVSSLPHCERGCVGHARVALGFSAGLSHPSLFSLFHPLLFNSAHIKGPQTTAEPLKRWKGLC